MSRKKKPDDEKAVSKNMTLSPRMMMLANQIMEARHFGDDFSGMVQTLLREEYERRREEIRVAESITNETIAGESKSNQGKDGQQ